ncbi:MAG TPA: nuclear transport factor 2 family protein [Opitutaceae bacterium]|nr:nuclear transport factor 2 family protein [Opitutaceae bacterium]
MQPTTRAIEEFWTLANARDWTRFAALLHPGLVYEIPQTREQARGAEAFLDVFRTWPGAWRVVPTRIVGDARRAVSEIEFHDGAGVATGISFFEFSDGLICRITDFWPEPYEPPPRQSCHLRRVE